MQKLFVFFDLDSTLVKIEGLDWLAQYKGKDGKVKELTNKAMGGSFPFRKALLSKLEIIKPTKKEFEILSQAYLENITEGAKETIKRLKQKGAEVFIVTGSFYSAVYPLAGFLGIKKENVYANRIYFDEKGNYKGIDLNNPLSANGGKPKIVKKLLEKENPKPFSVFIGDSTTDLETKEVVDLFIGFGGVVEREKVKKTAEVFIKDLLEIPRRILKQE